MNQNDALSKRIQELENRLIEMDLYRTFVEEARGGQGFFRHDISGKITYINAHVSDMLELPAESIVGKHWREVLNISEAAKATMKSGTLDLYAGKEPPTYSIEYVTPSNTIKTFEIQQGPLKNPSGKLIAVYGSINDVTAQHRSREHIRELANRLDLTWKSYDAISTVGIGIVNNRQLVTANKKLETITGYTLHELMNSDLKRLYLTEEHYLQAGEALYHNTNPDGSGEVETRWLRKDGKEIDCLIRIMPMIEAPDGTMSYMALAQDVTEQKRAKATLSVLYDIIKALNATEDLDGLIHSIYDSLAQIINTTNIYIALYNALDDKITFPYYRDIDDIREIPHASRSGSVTAEVILTGKPLLLDEAGLTTRFSRDIGSRPIGKQSKVWLGVPLMIKQDVIGVLAVQSYSDPLCYTADDIPLLESVSGYIATAINRRTKEKYLRESEQRYRDIFERTYDIIYVHDLEGKFIESNLKYKQELFPAALPEDLIVDNVKDVLTDDYSHQFPDYMNKVLENGHDKGLMAVRSKITGREMIFEYNNRLIRDASGAPSRIQGTARDVTVQFRRKREKQAMEKQLLQAQKMEAIGTLTSGIAHDFNNILYVIRSYAQLGEEIDSIDIARSYFTSIHNCTSRARDLINRLLIFSRPMNDILTPIDIRPSVREVVKFVRESLPSTIEIRQSITPDAVQINGDPSQIHQVVMNLVTNAIQAIADQHGVIEVCLSSIVLECKTPGTGYLPPGTYIELIVRDTGPGMEKATLERIFDPFFTTKQMGVGTGLGLSMVHGIVKSHKGHIHVDSEPGRGSIFKIYFPECIGSMLDIQTALA